VTSLKYEENLTDLVNAEITRDLLLVTTGSFIFFVLNDLKQKIVIIVKCIFSNGKLCQIQAL
jgi:hypothetical protein